MDGDWEQRLCRALLLPFLHLATFDPKIPMEWEPHGFLRHFEKQGTCVAEADDGCLKPWTWEIMETIPLS